MRQKAVGTVSGPAVLEVEKGAIKRFAEAVGDANPLWNDEASARKSRFGGILAPPTFLRSVRLERPQLPFDTPFNRFLDAGSQWEYFEPVRPGDRITAVTRVSDLTERAGRLGPMMFVVFEITYTNQLDHLAAVQRSTLIWY
jgi:acyl dehydratase